MVKDLQVSLGNTNSTQNMHEYELAIVFDKLSVFQEGILQNIRTVIDRVDNMEASTLTGFMDQGSSHL